MEFKVKFDLGNRKRANVMVRGAKDKNEAYKVAFKKISEKHPYPFPVCIHIEKIETIKDEAEKLANLMGFSFNKKRK